MENINQNYLKNHILQNIQIRTYSCIDSTNNEAKRNLDLNPCLFVAEEQTNGRGRKGRSFYSPRDKGIYTEASMNPIMVDGTGMCGACRVTVGGETKFACVDGPDFDAHKIDFDEVINRTRIYKDQERKRCENCNLLKQTVK